MKICFYYYMGGGGGLANIHLLLRAMARNHPRDTFEIVTSPATDFGPLQDCPNVRITRFRKTGIKELDRLLLNTVCLPSILRKKKADLLWSMNIGPYVKPAIPSVLSIHNPHQVSDWASTRLHPGTRLRVVMLRAFFLRSVGLSDGVIAQTGIMAGHVRRARQVPSDLCVIPKAVEKERDVPALPLPQALRDALDGGLGRSVFSFVYASSFVPHKNHAVLIRVGKGLKQKNVKARIIVTINETELKACGGKEAEDLLRRGYLVAAGWVAKPHLRALYEASDACLMPSMLESLSSSFIEAMQWRRPQIVSDLPFARDVCGNAALYAHPEEEGAWLLQIDRIMKDEELRQTLINAGLKRMEFFPTSWDQAAEEAYRFMMSVQQSRLKKENKTCETIY